MKSCVLWLFALLLIGLHYSYAQIAAVKVHEAVQHYGPCEPSIAINPQNPSNVVATSVLNNAYYTMDGGKTWKRQLVSSPLGVWGDPCVIADPKGDFYYFHLANPEEEGWKSEELLNQIVCQKSADQGKNWSEGVGIGYHDSRHDQDKEWACVDPHNNHLYITWTEFDKYKSRLPTDSSYILFSKSTDKADSWSEPVRINQKAGNCLDDDKTVEGAVPTVGPGGEIYVAWAFDDTIYFDRSMDEGKSWLAKDKAVVDQPGGWNYGIPGIERCNGMPVTICDISHSPHRGTIYINWTDARNGKDDTDVWIAKSTDRGDTWSEPVRVNDDAAGHQQFLTWLTIDQTTGYLYAVFYDRRHYEDNRTDVYLAYSTDGGESFTNLKITEQPFLMKEDGPFFGDYNHIAAHEGNIYPIWTQVDRKKLSIWTARLLHDELLKVSPEDSNR